MKPTESLSSLGENLAYFGKLGSLKKKRIPFRHVKKKTNSDPRKMQREDGLRCHMQLGLAVHQLVFVGRSVGQTFDHKTHEWFV